VNVSIRRACFDDMRAHAAAAYPEECCGLLTERDGVQEVVRVTNVQNEMHARDPEQFPRTAATAYLMGPEAAPVLLGVDRGDRKLLAIYHSHPEHDAYFSAEDRLQALGGWDEPTYADAAWIVFSVRQGAACAVKAFLWDAAAADFAEVPVEEVE